MILIAGGTGRLGTAVVRLLTERGLPVQVLTRDRAHAGHLEADGVEVAVGNVREADTLKRALAGVNTVISAVQGFSGSGDDSPKTVDWLGNRNLIRAAEAAGVEHFILLSVYGAASDHPMELFRMKRLAEEELRASRLDWTIVRPTAYMETWAALIGEPLMQTGKTRIFGRAVNPINFVSVSDVAQCVASAVDNPSTRGAVFEVGGPENLTLRQFAETFADVAGKPGSISNVPLPMMRMMATLMRPLRPTLARQIQAGVVMDTHDMSFDPAETTRRYPAIKFATLADIVRRDYGVESQRITAEAPQRSTPQPSST